jgi:hypothetical protein
MRVSSSVPSTPRIAVECILFIGATEAISSLRDFGLQMITSGIYRRVASRSAPTLTGGWWHAPAAWCNAVMRSTGPWPPADADLDLGRFGRVCALPGGRANQAAPGLAQRAPERMLGRSISRWPDDLVGIHCVVAAALSPTGQRPGDGAS